MTIETLNAVATVICAAALVAWFVLEARHWRVMRLRGNLIVAVRVLDDASRIIAQRFVLCRAQGGLVLLGAGRDRLDLRARRTACIYRAEARIDLLDLAVPLNVEAAEGLPCRRGDSVTLLFAGGLVARVNVNKCAPAAIENVAAVRGVH